MAKKDAFSYLVAALDDKVALLIELILYTKRMSLFWSAFPMFCPEPV